MKFICKNCYEQFDKPNKQSSRMGFAWIVFIFFSMGIGLLFWLFMRGKAKDVCPYCKSESIILTDSIAGKMLIADIEAKTQTVS